MKEQRPLFIGVDPGASGAIMGIFQGAKDPFEIARNDATETDVSNAVKNVRILYDCRALIEKVGAMPKQGVSSTFKFGRSYGFLRGLLVAHGIPFEEVLPRTWQGGMHCMSKGDKNVTKSRAQALWPGCKWIHRTADAALIAEYARRTWK